MGIRMHIRDMIEVGRNQIATMHKNNNMVLYCMFCTMYVTCYTYTCL